MKENIDVTIITSQPNNGYLAIVFQDDGALVTTNCGTEDAYNGLTRATAKLLLNVANEIAPAPDPDKDGVMTPEIRTRLEKHAAVLEQLVSKFKLDLQRAICTIATAEHFMKRGMSSEKAQMLAAAMQRVTESMRSELDNDNKEEKDTDGD